MPRQAPCASPSWAGLPAPLVKQQIHSENTSVCQYYQYPYLGAFGLNRHWGLAFAMRRWDVERVDLAALGKCGSRIGLVSSRASSACEVPVELAGGPNFKQAAILVTAVGPGDYLGLSVC